ncbi:MAG: YnbE family lipoprotein [Nitrospira sp.]|nr:YnbE family lipoprotein [Nitrospira sp.]MBH0196694.1 YnbE family lipoprotein [Nitrospira sp.]
MQRPNSLTIVIGVVIGGVLVAIGACTPRIEVASPDKPITINLNVKIDHEIRVKVDKDLDKVLSDDSGLF